MVIALLVLLGFGILFTFAFDEDLQGSDQSIESVVRHQQREIDGYLEGVKNREDRLAAVQQNLIVSSELEATTRQMRLREATLTGLNESLATSKQAVISEKEAFEGYKEDYRAHVRTKAVGEVMEELTTVTGEVYKKVEIREVTPIGIQIRHEDGQKRISFEDLSDEWKERFQFDPKKKEDALAAENEMQVKHDTAVAVASQSFEKEQADAKAQKAIERKKEAARSITALKMRNKQLNSEITALENGLRNQSGIKRTSEVQAVIRTKREQVASVLAEIERLQKELRP